MRTLFLILMVALVCGQLPTMAQTAQGTTKYGEVKSKVLSGPDSDGDVWFSVKVEVRNESNTDKVVSITVRGLDSEGFEVIDLTIESKVKAGQRRDFTDSTYVNYKSYQTIVKWEVED